MKTELVFVIDRSGSMSGIRGDMEGGFNEYIENQKKLPGECNVTLCQFDDHFDTVYYGPIADMPRYRLEPRGSTALMDAMGRTMVAVGGRLAAMKEADRPEKVLIVVITDGHENSSREFGASKIREMVKHQTEKYSWDFVFLGANQDAVLSAAEYGIRGNTATYKSTSSGTRGMLRTLDRSTGLYRSSGTNRSAPIITQDDVDDEGEDE